jgi:tetratricopeptide (TPR) repeat protein
MRLNTRFISALLSIGLLTASGAQAQNPPSGELVQLAIDRTDVRIEQAEALVLGSDNAQAALHLEAAVSLQGRARTSFAAAEMTMALRLTIEARDHADRAIAIIRNLPDPDRVKAQLERTRELLERARERIEECNNERARAMLRAAFEMQVRAEEAAASGRYLVALRLTVNARERAQNALRLCNLEENIQEAADRAIQRTDLVLTRAQDAIEDCDDEKARASLAQALELQSRAKAEFTAERYRAALSLTMAARRAAYRAVRLCGHGD